MKNKKSLVFAALAIVLLGVGAFTIFKPGGGDVKPKVVAVDERFGGAEQEIVSRGGASAAVKADPVTEQLMAIVTGPIPRRDPFQPTGAAAATAAAKVVPTSGNAYPTSTAPRPDATASRLPGNVAPMNPMAGGGSMGISQGTPLRQPEEFAYTVKGVVVGAKSVVILEDESGNQRMVPLGASVDGDSKVVGIAKGKVRIRHRGKDQTLTLSEGQ